MLARLVVSGSYMLSSASAAAPVHGLERMARVDLLPAFLENTQVRQVSSRDRGGGNDDGFNGRYSALYTDRNGEHVMFDDIGPQHRQGTAIFYDSFISLFMQSPLAHFR